MAKARVAVKENIIHSYYIATQGLVIKFVENGRATAVTSLVEMDNIIQQTSNNMVIDDINIVSDKANNEIIPVVNALPKIKFNGTSSKQSSKSKSNVNTNRTNQTMYHQEQVKQFKQD